ncbi:MAG TPA: hypothetical protein VFP35_03225 [Candidatus Saccharimonadales bacterium]|nr:hypothetical protein [Candidatus Saccharimonadales bacterium]
MSLICPTVLADTPEKYTQQIKKIDGLGRRVQIDLTDGRFAPAKTISPAEAWWPAGRLADFHLMFKSPAPAIADVLAHQPNLIIVHAEADFDFEQVYTACRDHAVKLGMALLADTGPEVIENRLNQLDHALIFSGQLGSYGGHADLSLLDKVKFLKSKKADLEVGWDGGINNLNIAQLVEGGVDVLNVGGFIQGADDPAKAYTDLARIAEETGTT